MKLSKIIEELAEEVTSSRAYIDKLLKTAHDTQESDWEKREAQYKTVIQNLRQQIRKQAPAVSIDLYKTAVDDGKQKQAELRSAEKTISALESKLTKLEIEKKERVSSATAKTPKSKPRSERNILMSPTDFLEKGLLSKDFQYSKDYSTPNFPAKTPSRRTRPQTPSAEVPIDIGSILADLGKTSKKQTDVQAMGESAAAIPMRNETKAKERSHRGDQGSSEKVRKQKPSVPKPRATKLLERKSRGFNFSFDPNLQTKPKTDLTGLTISFQKSLNTLSELNEISQICEQDVRIPFGSQNHPSKYAQSHEEDVLAWVDEYAKQKERETQDSNKETRRDRTKSSKQVKQVKVRTHQDGDHNFLNKSEKLKRAASRPQAKIAITGNSRVRKDPGSSMVHVSRQSRKLSASKNVPMQDTGNSDIVHVKSNHVSKPMSTPSRTTAEQKENQEPTQTPKSVSKSSLRMRKIREIGGRKALQDKLKKMRSPPPRGKTLPLRPLQVL
jgi:hypothetical protein